MTVGLTAAGTAPGVPGAMAPIIMADTMSTRLSVHPVWIQCMEWNVEVRGVAADSVLSLKIRQFVGMEQTTYLIPEHLGHPEHLVHPEL